MTAQLLLILALIALAIYSFRQRAHTKGIATAMLIICIIGIFFVAIPTATTKIANAIGLGRGADLLLYVFILIFLVALFLVHLRLRAINAQYTELVRFLAVRDSVENRGGK